MIAKRLLSFVLFALIIFGQTEQSLSTWDFSMVGLPNDVPIWRFAVWKNRAFLAVPVFHADDTWDEIADRDTTLIEGGWPEPGNSSTGIISRPAVQVFPKFSELIEDECERLSSVTALDVDLRGRLWVLDSSQTTPCPAKIVIYDLRNKDARIAQTDFQDVPKYNLKSLVIDPFTSIWGTRAYIGDPGDESIITYSLIQRKWWRLQLVHGPEVPRVYSTEMAVSRTNDLLYITDPRSENLFSVNLDNSIMDKNSSVKSKNGATLYCPVEWLGTKMGHSSGLICDHRGGLHYFLVTEHASVRWNTKHDLKASSYSIVLQNEEVPCITDYRLDSQKNVWGLVNLEHPFAKSPSTEIINEWHAKFRTVQIYQQ